MGGIAAHYQSRLHERAEIRLREILATRDAKRRAQVGRRLRLPLEKLQKPDRAYVVPLLDNLRDIPRRFDPRRIELARPIKTKIWK